MPKSRPTLSRLALPIGLLCGLAFGCQFERLFPDDVGVGIARLSVRNSAILLKMILADETCGLSSPTVLESARLEGEIGGQGTLTLLVDNCTIDFGALSVKDTGCDGVDTSVGGRATVTATQVVHGTLTGNPENPIIPNGPDAATVEVSAQLEEYEVRFSNRLTGLRMVDVDIAFDARPHLAVSDSLGVCGVATPNLTLESIRYARGDVLVDSGEGSFFPVEVGTSSYRAQIGPYNGAENWFEGEIHVWGEKVMIPPADPDVDQRLDPDYDVDDYLASFACAEDLRLPVAYECESLLPAQAQGVAALTVSSFGNLVALTEAHCFSRPDVVNNPELAGQIGREGGEARYEITDCVIDLGAQTTISTDCLGASTFASGIARVSGQKIVRGYATGDIAEPIVPLGRDPALMVLDIQLENFAIFDSESVNKMTITSGSLTGTARPSTTLDLATRVCSAITPHAEFENVVLTDAPVLLETDGMTFRLNVQSTTLTAQNGKKGARENYLAGAITLEGSTMSVPTDGGEPILNPSYDRGRFEAGYLCAPDIATVASDEACANSFYGFIGENAARLVVQTVGTVASMVNADGDCGFDNTFGQLQPDEVIGEPGEFGQMSWSVDACALGSEDLSVYATDCVGATTYTQGTATVDAGRTVNGMRETQFFLFDSIRPDDHQRVDVTLQSVALTEFAAYTVPANGGEPAGILTIHNGTVGGLVKPILGERASDPGLYDVATPIARLEGVWLQDGTATLESAGKTFILDLDDVMVRANNGIYGGMGNTISGSLRVNGRVVEFNETILNPDFAQSSFNDSYVCTEDLAALVPTE